jgi:hypothetical protein
MLIAFTYLPGFVTMVFHGMPTVWRGRHRLIFCWLIFMQAVSPGRKKLEEMARWTPATITAWRIGRLLKAAYWTIKTKGFALNDEPERVPHQRWCSNKKGARRPPPCDEEGPRAPNSHV